jgi:hypothetical protein
MIRSTRAAHDASSTVALDGGSASQGLSTLKDI